MKSVIYVCMATTASLLFLAGGCVSKTEYDRCVNRNQIQMERIASLEAEIEAERLKSEQLRQELERQRQKEGYWEQQAKALKAALDAKIAELARLAEMMGQGPVALPAELSNELAEWARNSGSDLVTFDEKTGMVRFTSDLLFDLGDDTVKADVIDKIKGLATIMNSDSAKGFDLLIVGHTDDIPIKKPSTVVKHPSNWHLSAHRAIAVENILASAGMAETRQAIMGMGEFRPIEPNAAGKKGNHKNRRVDIYVVPAGQIRISAPAGAAPAAHTPAAAPAASGSAQ